MFWISALAFAAGTAGSSDTDSVGSRLVPPPPPTFDDPGVAPVVGGHPVEDGKWDDTVGVVMLSAFVGCTGTLVGPRVVLTAGHCVLGYPVTHVLIGSKDWAENGGELIEVEAVHEYPNSQGTFDIAVLELAEASTYTPREIGLECVLDEYLDDGAPVQIVGFGGTRADGRDYYNSVLNEVATRVLDKNCSDDTINGIVSGCQPAARPGGELAAGGDGKDACFGDSGGPLYLKTEQGDYVVGVTSRAFLGASYSEPCTDGGIWVRPDAVFDWIQSVSGGKKLAVPSCNAAPEVDVPDMKVRRNHPKSVDAKVTDADGDAGAATFAIARAPEHGTAEVDADGVVTYTPEDGFVGEDSFTLAVTDEGSPDWEYTGDPVTVEVEVPVDVRRTILGVGCSSTGAAGSWLLLGAAALIARRKRAA